MIDNVTKLLMRFARKTVTSPREAWLLVRMAWWVVVLSAAARLYSLPRALEIVAGNGRATRVDASESELAHAIDLLLATDVLMFKPICWKRAAVLHRYLSRSGIPTRIIFGVRNENDGKFAGHAWLEREGRPILETTPPEYVVTYSFP